MAVRADERLVHTREIRNSPGLYVERFGEVRITSTTWGLVTRINVSHLFTYQIELERVYGLLTKRCIEPRRNCTAIDTLNVVGHKLEILEEKRDKMIGLLDSKRRRRKRWAPFGYLGTLQSIIYGIATMDEIKDLEKALNENQNDTKRLATAFAKQTELVQSQLKTNAKDIAEINKEIKILEGKLNITTNYVDTLEKQRQTNELINALESRIADLETDIGNAINAILFAKIGKIHPNILAAKDLLLKCRDIQLDNINTEFPVPLTLQGMANLLDVADIVVYYMNAALVSVIKIPLMQLEKFTNFRNYILLVKQ